VLGSGVMRPGQPVASLPPLLNKKEKYMSAGATLFLIIFGSIVGNFLYDIIFALLFGGDIEDQ